MIVITEKAKQKLVEVMVEDGTDVIRFGLKGGGCSGFQYYFAMESIDQIDETDEKIALDENHNLVVDLMSLMYLEDAEIDYKKDMMGETFVFKNPNATRTCGCGHSQSFD